MSDAVLRQSFDYNFSLIVVLVFIVWWLLSGRVARLEKKHKVNSDVIEGMCANECVQNPYANTGFRNGEGYIASDSIIGGPAGTNRFSNEQGCAKKSGFFGGSEPPVFYDIGDVRAARTTRGWSTGYATDAAGNPVYDASGNPVMASKAGDYKSVAARRALYGSTNTTGYNTSENKLRALGYVPSIDSLTGKTVWKTPVREGLWAPANEGLWAPANEGFKSDEELFNQR